MTWVNVKFHLMRHYGALRGFARWVHREDHREVTSGRNLRKILFDISFNLTMPVLQTGADLAWLYRRWPYAQPFIIILWAPVRLAGISMYWVSKKLAPKEADA